MPVRSQNPRRPQFRQPDLPPAPVSMRLGDDFIRAIGTVWLPALIFLIPLIYFWPVLYSGFVSDDYFYHLTFVYGLEDYIHKAALIHAGEFHFPFIRPVVFAAFRIDYLIWGPDPVGFHFTNLLLHSTNAVLLFYLVRNLGLSRLGGAIAALFFALYPTNPEAVTWVSGRFDLLAITFLFITYLTWCNARLTDNPRWMIPSLISFFLAILSKENAAAGMLVLPLIDWILHAKTSRERGTGVGAIWQWYVVFLAVVMVILAFRYWLYWDIGGYEDEFRESTYFAAPLTYIWHNLVNNLWILITPISRILWPEWSQYLRIAFITGGVILGLLMLESLIWSGVQARQVSTWALTILVTAILWMIIMVLPVLPLEEVEGSLNRTRFLYPAIPGIALWIGLTADMGLQYGRSVRNFVIIILIAVLILSGVALRRHNETWIEAGDIARRIAAVMEANTSDIPDDTDIFVINYPWLWKGAHCAPINYSGFVEYRYGTEEVDIQIMRLDPSDPAAIDTWWQDIKYHWARPGIGFVWNRDTETMRVLPLFYPRTIPDERLWEIFGPDVSERSIDRNEQETTAGAEEEGPSETEEEVEVLPEPQ